MTEPSRWPRHALVAALAGLVVHCGGAAQSGPASETTPSKERELETTPAAAPASPASAPGAAGGGAAPANAGPTVPSPAPGPPPPPPAPPPPPTIAPPVATPADEPSRRDSLRISARAELDRAVHDLEAAASDCDAACRALASMDRATSHLCALADQDDDRRRCEDARGKLADARRRVRGACGTCP